MSSPRKHFLAFVPNTTKVTSVFRTLRQAAAVCLVVAGGLVGSTSAWAGSPYLEVPDAAGVVDSPAYRYANMQSDEVFAELDRRKILYSKEQHVDGVLAPIRLTGRLHGVLIRSALPPEERTTSVFEILDARLALALDDFAAMLAKQGVVEIIHYTMYRPNTPAPGSRFANQSPKDVRHKEAKSKPRSSKRRAALSAGTPKGAKAGKAGRFGPRSKQKFRTATTDEHAHGKWAPPGTRHPAGLAIDVGGFRMADGRLLSVAQFAGKIGQQTCGTGAPVPISAEARELRQIVCDARSSGLFTYALTPNYDQDHHDHFHLEIKPGVMWFLYH